jgi:hypothetical protein
MSTAVKQSNSDWILSRRAHLDPRAVADGSASTTQSFQTGVKSVGGFGSGTRVVQFRPQGQNSIVDSMSCLLRYVLGHRFDIGQLEGL